VCRCQMGTNLLFCMPNRSECCLLVSVMRHFLASPRPSEPWHSLGLHLSAGSPHQLSQAHPGAAAAGFAGRLPTGEVLDRPGGAAAATEQDAAAVAPPGLSLADQRLVEGKKPPTGLSSKAALPTPG
jgi:hypothetical protein